MITLPAAPLGRGVPRIVGPADRVRVEVRLPADVAAMLYASAADAERSLSSIAAHAIRRHLAPAPVHRPDP